MSIQIDNLGILKDLTICVPVRDRQVNLSKILSYYKNVNCKKIIFDTSKYAYDNDDLVKEAGFDYVYWGPIPYFEKWQKILSIVDTKYFIDCPDDDIALITSLPPCVEFLNENEDYSACCGIELGFFTETIYPVPSTQMYINQLFYDYKSDNVYDRIEYFLAKRPVSMWHSVQRSQVCRDYWDMINSEKQIQYLGYFEFMHAVHVSANGNIKVLPTVFRMRNFRKDKHAQRVHQVGAAPEELKINKNLKDNLNFGHFLPMLSEIRKHDTQKSLSESFDFLKKVHKQNATAVSEIMSLWPRKGEWKLGRVIPDFAPKGYRAKEIVNQKQDLAIFSRLWCGESSFSHVRQGLYFEGYAAPELSPSKKNKDTTPDANKTRQSKK